MTDRPAVGRAVRDHRTRLLHPASIFGLVWAVAFLVWALLPDADFIRLTGTPRYLSASSLLFVGLALLAFVIGCGSGPVLLGATQAARKPLSWDRADLIGHMRGGATVALVVGLLASALLLYQASELAGGIDALVGKVLSGVPMAYLTTDYFIPARITGLTTWVHFNTAVAPLATLGWMLSSRNGASVTFFRSILVIAFLNAVLIAFTQSERLGLYEFIVAAAVTFLGARLATHEHARQTRRVVGVAAVIIALAGVAWFTTEYGRTYQPRYGETIGAPSSFGVAWDQLITYVVTNLNNGMYAVDHAQVFTFPLYTLNGVLNTFGLDSLGTPYIGTGIAETGRLIASIYPTGAFTTFSLPGYAFLELGWGGLILVYWFGAIVGIVYARLRAGELWAILIYPLVVVGVIDSFRTMYWSQSRLLIPVIVIAFVVAQTPRHSAASQASALKAEIHRP